MVVGAHEQVEAARGQHARFVRWLLGSLALIMLAIGALNWFVDPTGVTGRTTRWQIADNSEVRSAKLDLYEAAIERGDAPEVVLLGSSRTMKFDPAVVEELTGRRAFNAAVSGGVPRDAWLFTQFMAKHQGGKVVGDDDAEEGDGDSAANRAEFPHIIWGFDADAFRAKRVRDGLTTDPRMAQFVPWTERAIVKVASAGALTELQTLQATIRSLRAGGNADDPGRPRFTPAGMQLFSHTYEKRDVMRNRAIRRQARRYADAVFARDGWERVEEGPVAEFVNVMRVANEHGGVPTVFVTPYHALAEEQLARFDLDGKRAEAIARLEELRESGEVEFELVDLSDPNVFGADPREWYDGVHMTPANTERALDLLHERRLLAP